MRRVNKGGGGKGWFISFPVKIETLFLLLGSQECHWNTVANAMISPSPSFSPLSAFCFGVPNLLCLTLFNLYNFSVSQDTSVSNSRKLNQAHVNKTKGNWRWDDCQGTSAPPEVELPPGKLHSGIWALLHPILVQCFHTSPIVRFVLPE